jgi:hypothetical protein
MKWTPKPTEATDDSNDDNRGYIATAQIRRVSKMNVELAHQITGVSQREYIDTLISEDINSAVKAGVIADATEDAIWAVLDDSHRDNVRKVFPRWTPPETA